MIVSRDLGFFQIHGTDKRRERRIAPQYNPGTVADVFGDHNTDVPFSTHPAKSGLAYCPDSRSFNRRPATLETYTHSRPEGKYNNVPLKSEQYNSRPEGASVFYAPTPPYMRRLPVKEDVPREILITAFSEDYDVPFDHPLAYEMGIRPGIRSLPAQKLIAEPTKNLYRSNVAPVPQKNKVMDYNVGDAELKEMMRHMF
jgi:hypothetical protein